MRASMRVKLNTVAGNAIYSRPEGHRGASIWPDRPGTRSTSSASFVQRHVLVSDVDLGLFCSYKILANRPKTVYPVGSTVRMGIRLHVELWRAGAAWFVCPWAGGRAAFGLVPPVIKHCTTTSGRCRDRGTAVSRLEDLSPILPFVACCPTAGDRRQR